MTFWTLVLAIFTAWIAIIGVLGIIYGCIAWRIYHSWFTPTPDPVNLLKNWLPGAIAELGNLSPEQRDRAINCHKHISGPISSVMIKTWIKRYVNQPPERQHA